MKKVWVWKVWKDAWLKKFGDCKTLEELVTRSNLIHGKHLNHEKTKRKDGTFAK